MSARLPSAVGAATFALGGLLVALVVALLVPTLGACNSLAVPPSCADIPDGGCPEDNGAQVCADPTCNAVYVCDDGNWSYVMACPAHPHEAGVDAALEAEAEAEAAASDATKLPDVPFVVPPGAYGGASCEDPQLPDCWLGTAIACEGTADCCGCQDLWLCQNGGWVSWGQCTASGQLVPNQK
jgi:hypothetical protein